MRVEAVEESRALILGEMAMTSVGRRSNGPVSDSLVKGPWSVRGTCEGSGQADAGGRGNRAIFTGHVVATVQKPEIRAAANTDPGG